MGLALAHWENSERTRFFQYRTLHKEAASRKQRLICINQRFSLAIFSNLDLYIKKCRILIRGLGAQDTSKIEEMQEIQMRLGQKIRDLRKEKGWSQEDFADQCGIGRAHMSLIERGQQNLTLATLNLICNTLEITMSSILKEIG